MKNLTAEVILEVFKEKRSPSMEESWPCAMSGTPSPAIGHTRRLSPLKRPWRLLSPSAGSTSICVKSLKMRARHWRHRSLRSDEKRRPQRQKPESWNSIESRLPGDVGGVAARVFGSEVLISTSDSFGFTRRWTANGCRAFLSNTSCITRCCMPFSRRLNNQTMVIRGRVSGIVSIPRNLSGRRNSFRRKSRRITK